MPQYLNGRIKKFNHDYYSDPSCKRHLDNLQIEVGVLHLFLNNGRNASKPWGGGGGGPTYYNIGFENGAETIFSYPSPLFIFASNVNDGKNVNMINVL